MSKLRSTKRAVVSSRSRPSSSKLERGLRLACSRRSSAALPRFAELGVGAGARDPWLRRLGPPPAGLEHQRSARLARPDRWLQVVLSCAGISITPSASGSTWAANGANRAQFVERRAWLGGCRAVDGAVGRRSASPSAAHRSSGWLAGWRSCSVGSVATAPPDAPELPSHQPPHSSGGRWDPWPAGRAADRAERGAAQPADPV